MQISVIIPAYNEEKYIKKTLIALSNQTLDRSKYEIIVCNDASTDKTEKIALKYADKVLNLKKCKTIAQVRNIGVKKSSGNMLVFIDADTIVPKGFLKEVRENLKRKNYYVAPKIFFSNNPIIKTAYELNYLLLKTIPHLGILPGCCLAVNKKDFQRVKGFDERLAACEDIYLNYKLLNKGYKLKILDTIVKTSNRKLKKLGLEKLIKIQVFDPLFKAPQNVKYVSIR